jgi:Carboxypeptidase regulatory-like domain
LRCLCALHLLLLILYTTTVVIAQSTDATVSGLVLDPSGRAIPDAEILILNDATGVRYPSATNKEGLYTVSILPPGQYRVQVSKGGFKSIIKPGVILNVQSAVVLNFTLPLGATSETVTVDAGASQINTTDGSVSTVVDPDFVKNVPLNGRSLQDLLAMTPGAVTQSPQNAGESVGQNGDFSVNGQRTESNYYMVDGVSANTSAGVGAGGPGAAASGSVPSSTALGTTQSLVSVDALQEFRVESSTYSAEFGRTPGGQFSFVTKSGTNDFHGVAFDYLRNDFMDANDWFNNYYNKPKQALRQNDFGGTFGGPVTIPRIYDGKDRTFFFLSYEGLRLTQPQPATLEYVPSESMRQTAPPALQSILNAFPITNGIDYGTGLASFIQVDSLPSDIDTGSVRIDHSLGWREHVFFRLSDSTSNSTSRDLSVVEPLFTHTSTGTLGLTSSLSNHSEDNLRLGYSASHTSYHFKLDTFGGAVPIDLPLALGINTGEYPRPYSYFYISIPGTGATYLGLLNGDNLQKQWNLVDSLAWSVRSHELKFGVDYRRVASPLEPYNPYVFDYYASEQEILANSAAEAYILKSAPATPIYQELSLFASDVWHIRPTLSLSSGVRWEFDPPPGAADGNLPYTISGNIQDPASITLAPKNTGLWKATRSNFAPRFGVAWNVHGVPGKETIVRAGGGIFFDTGNEYASNGYSGIGYGATNILLGATAPLAPDAFAFSPSVTPPYSAATIYAFDPHLQLPYTWQWSAAVEQSVGKTQAFTLTYVGSNGRRLLENTYIDLASENPEFGYINYYRNGLSSVYNALQVQFQRSVGHGLHALASYTWSHSSDYGSTNNAYPYQRGDSDFDVRNNFVGAMTWDLPSGSSHRLLAPLTNGWGLDGHFIARTGFPIFIYNGASTLVDPVTGIRSYSGVNIVPSQPFDLYGSQYPGRRSLNPAAFSPPAPGQAGDAPRNFLRGFGAVQANLGARREFPLGSRVKLQFRAETFNIFNHPNFGIIDTTLSDLTFGQATRMLNQSLGTVSSLYQQGGPRSGQIALKLLF